MLKVVLYSNSFDSSMKLPKNVVHKKINEGKLRLVRYQDQKDGNKLFEMKRNSIESVNNNFNKNIDDNIILVSNFGLNLLSQLDFEFLDNIKHEANLYGSIK